MHIVANGDVLLKEDDDWVKKYMEYEVEDLERGCTRGLSSS